MTSESEPVSRPAQLDVGTWAVHPAGSSAALGMDDWAFGQVEATLASVTGTVLVPWCLRGETTVGDGLCAQISVDLAALATGHRRLDRRLRSAEMLDVDRHRWLRLRATHPEAERARWRLTGTLTLGSITEAAGLTARLVAPPAVDTARVAVDVRVDRRTFGMTRYRHRIGQQLRLHLDAELHRIST